MYSILNLNFIIMLWKKFIFDTRQFIKRNFFNKKDKFSFLEGMIISKIKKNNFFNIVQVGAMDGKTNDPLFQLVNLFPDEIRLLAIEADEECFKSLKITYENFKNVYCINKLIGNGEKQKFYTEHSTKLKHRGLSSLEINSISKRVDKKNIVCNEIQSYKLQDVINSINNFKKIDLLQIDAEGYDDKIILESDILKTDLKYINYEHKNLDKYRHDNLKKNLELHNFKIIQWNKSDEFAFKLS